MTSSIIKLPADASQKRSWANGEKSQHDYIGSKTRAAAVSETV